MTRQPPQKVHLVSLGCPKNTVDSERMLGLLQGNDYELTADPEKADVVVVNTCGFIGPAKEESIEAVMAAHKLKKEGNCKGVIVTGCLATRYEQELKRDLVEADQILTIDEEPDIVRRVDALLGNQRASYIPSSPRTELTPATGLTCASRTAAITNAPSAPFPGSAGGTRASRSKGWSPRGSAWPAAEPANWCSSPRIRSATAPISTAAPDWCPSCSSWPRSRESSGSD